MTGAAGLGFGGGPWFVIKKDVENNILYVSHGYDPPAMPVTKAADRRNVRREYGIPISQSNGTNGIRAAARTLCPQGRDTADRCFFSSSEQRT